jgi:hypothetical protein
MLLEGGLAECLPLPNRVYTISTFFTPENAAFRVPYIVSDRL